MIGAVVRKYEQRTNLERTSINTSSKTVFVCFVTNPIEKNNLETNTNNLALLGIAPANAVLFRSQPTTHAACRGVSVPLDVSVAPTPRRLSEVGLFTGYSASISFSESNERGTVCRTESMEYTGPYRGCFWGTSRRAKGRAEAKQLWFRGFEAPVT